MKAFLLAAGKGTRLRPYTDAIPKCLIPVHGKPLLEIWIDLLESCRIDEILINTHHHAEKVEQFVTAARNRKSAKIALFYERNLLGSAGTVLANRNFVAGADEFIIAYADNLTDIDLKKMIHVHRACRVKGGILTMGLIQAPDPRACGIVVMDEDKKIIKFTEKPRAPESDWANGGVYVASNDIFDFFPMPGEPPRHEPLDFGLHVLPALVGKMYGYKIPEYLKDIGTIESYHQALAEWPANR